MFTKLLFGDNARKQLKIGVDTVANAAKVTLGYKGRNVIGETITKDGVTVAKSIVLKNKSREKGAKLIKDMAEEVNKEVGDGTTTSIILTQAIINGGLKLLATGISPIEIRKDVEKSLERIEKKLKEQAIPVKEDDLEKIASISANDNEIGKIVADMVKRVGKDGHISIEESSDYGIKSKFVEGMSLNRGYISPYMEKIKEIDNPKYLLTDYTISSINDILPIIEQCPKDLVIIAEDIEGEALASIVINNLQGNTRILGIKAPYNKDILEDIASLVGGEVITKQKGQKLKDVKEKQLGTSIKFKADRDNSLIIGGKNPKERIKKLKSIKAEGYEKELLNKRIANLVGGVGIITIGGVEADVKEKQYRIEDAINAVKSSVDGIVAGGGVALARCSNLKDLLDMAILEPLKQIAINAGKDGSLILYEVLNSNLGYNAKTDKMEDLFKSGVIDPLRVVLTALRKAVDTALIFLTSEVIINKYEDTK